MAKFFALEMANEVSQHPHISVNKYLFGWLYNVVYSPTDSEVESYSNYYEQDIASKFRNLINSKEEEFDQYLQPLINTQCLEIGAFRVDLCISHDAKFIAIQLNHIADGVMTHITPIRYFEGEQAQMVQEIFE